MSRHGSTSTKMPPELTNCLYVFLRQDSHRRPLAAPYEGPFKVLQRGAKSFQTDIGGGTETVSVDRLKPAHIDITQPVTVAPGKRRGRPPRQYTLSFVYFCLLCLIFRLVRFWGGAV